jgi:hypothetical protein
LKRPVCFAVTSLIAPTPVSTRSTMDSWQVKGRFCVRLDIPILANCIRLSIGSA